MDGGGPAAAALCHRLRARSDAADYGRASWGASDASILKAAARRGLQGMGKRGNRVGSVVDSVDVSSYDPQGAISSGPPQAATYDRSSPSVQNEAAEKLTAE